MIRRSLCLSEYDKLLSFFQLERELVAVLSTDLPRIVTSDLYKNAILKWEALSAKVLLLAKKNNSAVKTMLVEQSQEKRSVNGRVYFSAYKCIQLLAVLSSRETCCVRYRVNQ